MKKISLSFALLLFCSSCFEVRNSFESDAQFGGGPSRLDQNNESDLKLNEVREIFNTNCYNCHGPNGTTPVGYIFNYSNQQWLSNSVGGVPLLSASNPEASYIYMKLQKTSCAQRPGDPVRSGCTPGSGLCNMPVASPLSCGEEDAVIDWINSFNASDDGSDDTDDGSGDDGGGSELPEDIRLLTEVRSFFQNSCFNCHGPNGSRPAEYLFSYTNDQWTSNNAANGMPLVDPANPQGSYIYNKIHKRMCTQRPGDPSRDGCDPASGLCNMPTSGPVSCFDEDLIIDWINAL